MLASVAVAGTALLVTPNANAASLGAVLPIGHSITAGNSLDLGGRHLVMQPDGNLAMYNNTTTPGKACWATNTAGTGSHNHVIYQTDFKFRGIYEQWSRGLGNGARNWSAC